MQGKEIFVDFGNFRLGLYALNDTTDAPYGTARIMNNMRITDRGGIAPRQGTNLLGIFNPSTEPIGGLYNFRKTDGAEEFLIKAYADRLEAYSKDHSPSNLDNWDWLQIAGGFEFDSEFGFVTSLVNSENQDYVIGSNRFQPYFGWRGVVQQLEQTLFGGETFIPVNAVLDFNNILDVQLGTATVSTSATTLQVFPAPWAPGQWNGFYVYIEDGTYSGQIRRITDTTTDTITFETLPGDPGATDFAIFAGLFPPTGNLFYNGQTVPYTDVGTDPSGAEGFTVASAVQSDSAFAVLIATEPFPGNPRGNRLANYLNRIIVGNVRSAIAKGSGGADQGFSAAGTYFVSHVNDPFDFTFDATRVAGQGDLVTTPYGGGDITDVVTQEDGAYIFKNRYIESVAYSQDANDLAVRTPLKSGVGSQGRVIKGADDVYFITWDNRFTSLGRVKTKDLKPETENIGTPIKRLLESYTFGSGFGIEYKGRIYIPTKSTSTVTANDIVIVYNLLNQAFEGIWTLSVFGMEEFSGNLFFGDSTSSNVFQMLTGTADVVGDTRFPISAKYATQFLSLASIYPSTRRVRRSFSQTQQLSSLYFEGYIRGTSKLTFECWKDFAETPFLKFDFDGGIDVELLDGQVFQGFLGDAPLALRPMGSISEIGEDGYRHFQFRVYFPFQYGSYFSIGFESSQLDTDYEMIRLGMMLDEVETINTQRIKNL